TRCTRSRVTKSSRWGIPCMSAWARTASRPALPTGSSRHWRPAMDRNIGLEAVRLTEAAAIASARLMGRGDEKAADQAAVDAMRKAFNDLHIRGTIVIGEGERDEAPMLYIGEKV